MSYVTVACYLWPRLPDGSVEQAKQSVSCHMLQSLSCDVLFLSEGVTSSANVSAKTPNPKWNWTMCWEEVVEEQGNSCTNSSERVNRVSILLNWPTQTKTETWTEASDILLFLTDGSVCVTCVSLLVLLWQNPRKGLVKLTNIDRPRPNWNNKRYSGEWSRCYCSWFTVSYPWKVVVLPDKTAWLTEQCRRKTGNW